MTDAKDTPKYQSCVGSGFCCKQRPCPYGEAAPDTGWCIHLAPWEGDDLGVPRYRCGRYEYIKTQRGWEYIPAFGAGCSSAINTDRDLVVLALRRRDGPGDLKRSTELLLELFPPAQRGTTRPQKP